MHNTGRTTLDVHVTFIVLCKLRYTLMLRINNFVLVTSIY